MTIMKLTGWKRDVSYAVMAGGAVLAVLALGQYATFPNLPWFEALKKPSFNPPNWLFGPVWTTLYVMMAYAAWRVLRLPPSSVRTLALRLFFIQLGLNAAWSWMFFGAHSPALGLANIVVQLGVILATLYRFSQIDRVAAWCLIPLTAWVGYAAVLNAAVWWLNRG